MKSGRIDWAAAALLALAAAIVLWIRLLPLSLPGVPARAVSIVRSHVVARLDAERADVATPVGLRGAVDAWIAAHPAEFSRDVAAKIDELSAGLQYEDTAGRRRPFLGDYDSYLWLRAARNYLRGGSVCDRVSAGECRDTFTLAPVGTTMRYGRSLHTAAIVAVHRVATCVDPHYPLPASAYLVPVIVGALGVVPAFAIGRRLAGPVGGFVAAVVAALHPLLLTRSIGGDNDIWNSVLPLFTMWAVIAGVQARRGATRAACGVLAGAVTGLHAAIWRGWTFGLAVVLAGLCGVLLLDALRWVLRRRSWRAWRAPGVSAAAVVGLAYGAATAAGTYLAGGWIALPWLAAAGEPTFRAANATADVALTWPSALSLVSELAVPSITNIAAQSFGELLVFIAWIGVVLLFLPRRNWRVGHFAVLTGAALLYPWLLRDTGLARTTVVALLCVPLAAAVLVDALDTESSGADDAVIGMLIAAWLLAALLMAYEASRFIILLAAPMGIACGVAVGRLHLWFDHQARAGFGTSALLPRLVVGMAALTIALLPIRIGYATAAAELPDIDRAWADTLESLHATAAPDAILDLWWDYGHWAKYLAERRVSADGSTLLTHAPHWVARAQLAASEEEAVGLLRMLNCGSDAEPYREGERGAYGKLTRYGLDSRAAYDAVVRMASLSADAADDYLAGVGLDDSARADVLASTHCTPPASYLILSSGQVTFPGWWQLGIWDPRRPAATARRRGPGRGGFVTTDWVPCVPTQTGELRCEVRWEDWRGVQIDAVAYSPDDVHRTRVVSTTDGVEQSVAPALLIVADDDAIETVGGATASDDGPAVLLDRQRNRALVGAPSAINSVYTRLMFLDGRGTTRFRKVAEHTGASGERVATWLIEWAAP